MSTTMEILAATERRLQNSIETCAELRAQLTQGRAEYNAKLLAFDVKYAGWDYLAAACEVIGRAEQYRGFLHEFLSTHCASLDLRERATAAVGKPPLEFGRKEKP